MNKSPYEMSGDQVNLNSCNSDTVSRLNIFHKIVQ